MKKGGHYSREDIIYGRTLFKEIRYLKKLLSHGCWHPTMQIFSLSKIQFLNVSTVHLTFDIELKKWSLKLKNGCRQSLAILAKRDNYEHTRKAKAILQTFFQNSSYCREQRVVLCHAEAISSTMTKVEIAKDIHLQM